MKISVTTLSKESYAGVFCEYIPGKHIVLKNVLRRCIGPIENIKDTFVYPSMRFRIENIKEIGISEVFNGTGMEETHLILELLGHRVLNPENGRLDEGRTWKLNEDSTEHGKGRNEAVERILKIHKSPRIEHLSKILFARPTLKP